MAHNVIHVRAPSPTVVFLMLAIDVHRRSCENRTDKGKVLVAIDVLSSENETQLCKGRCMKGIRLTQARAAMSSRASSSVRPFKARVCGAARSIAMMSLYRSP